MIRYRWLHRPTDKLPGLLVATIGGVCFALLVEKTETGWRLTDGTGRQEDVAELPEDDEPPPFCGSLNFRHFDDPPVGPDRAA
jgi:hypothetical protein